MRVVKTKLFFKNNDGDEINPEVSMLITVEDKQVVEMTAVFNEGEKLDIRFRDRAGNIRPEWAKCFKEWDEEGFLKEATQ